MSLSPLDLVLQISCPHGIEMLLLEELESLGLQSAKAGKALVTGTADLKTAYQICMWSRLGNRVLLQLGTFTAANADEMYRALYQFAFSEHMSASSSFVVHFTGRGAGIDNTHFGALRVKDAIVDHFVDKNLGRPRVEKHNADFCFAVHAYRDSISLALDLSGQSLHKRSYRQQQGAAPLKENLAAAILLRANWLALAKSGKALVDPMCGVGTLLIEAALMAYDIAPNLQRQNWGFSKWHRHQAAVFAEVKAEALARAQKGKQQTKLWIRGYEADPRLIAPARNNLERAGIGDLVNIYQGDLQTFAPRPDHGQTGLLVVNPPYGVRLGEVGELRFLYQHLGERLREHCLNWQAAIFTGNVALCKQMGLRSHKQYAFKNGAIDCKLVLLDVVPRMFVNEQKNVAEVLAKSARQSSNTELSDGAQMFANRLKKNLQKLKSWRKREAISAYRLYDADLPEYAVAIDIYNDAAHVQEYAPPKTVPAERAEARLLEVLAVLQQVLGIQRENIALKRRERQSGSAQYQKLAKQSELMMVEEYGVKLLVNLYNYLDTGLFLDHRPLRRLIQQSAAGKRVLNLYCYTASISTHAAKAGARATINVDLSNTYLDWARKNYAANGIAGKHEFCKSDVFKWLKQAHDSALEKFDMIIIDPPTFSNSKNLQQDFDVQRDHYELVEAAFKLLKRDGIIYFSNNYRRFVLDARLQFAYQVADISKASLDPDFARNSKIHQAYTLQFFE